jgi:hypothetical protein
MKEVIEYIEAKNVWYAQHSFFKFLEDTSINPLDRLSITPCIAHFIMSFQDLNKFVYRDESIKGDLFQDVVNQHTYEDDHHWLWFLNDVKQLGFDKPTTFAETLKFLWSDATKKTRLLSYKLSALSMNALPLYKYIIIEAVEATGNVLFTRTTAITHELSNDKNKYIYFGDFHLAKETGHAVNTSHDLEAQLENYSLTEEEQRKAFEYVDAVFLMFSEWIEELLVFAKNQQAEVALV